MRLRVGDTVHAEFSTLSNTGELVAPDSLPTATLRWNVGSTAMTVTAHSTGRYYAYVAVPELDDDVSCDVVAEATIEGIATEESLFTFAVGSGEGMKSGSALRVDFVVTDEFGNLVDADSSPSVRIRYLDDYTQMGIVKKSTGSYFASITIPNLANGTCCNVVAEATIDGVDTAATLMDFAVYEVAELGASPTTHTVQSATRPANELTMTAACEDGEKFLNTGVEKLVIANESASSVTVTIITPATGDGLALADRQIAIPAGKTHYLGPWPTRWYNDSEGFTSFVCYPYADVAIAVIK